MPNDDFLTTIDSDDEMPVPVKPISSKSRVKPKVAVEDVDDGAIVINPDFTFDGNDDTYAEVLEEQEKLEGLLKGSKHVRRLRDFVLLISVYADE